MKIHIPSQLPIITFFSAFRQSHNRQVIIVLLLSGFLGFCVGMFGNSTLQVVVQTSQVVAGIVKYPPDNPNYIGQVGTWTILHQICAIFLHAGISERTLSFLFSGILGMLSFQAL